VFNPRRLRYGHEVARLASAQSTARRAFDTARRGASKLVLEDVKVCYCCPINYHLTIIQSLLEIVDSNLARAQRDNDLIYHQDVPSASLPVIQPASMVASVVPPGLSEPKKILGNDNLIFGELISWGAQTAIGSRGYSLIPYPPFIDRVPRNLQRQAKHDNQRTYQG
jgi:programmed cell death 6-interacting protein